VAVETGWGRRFSFLQLSPSQIGRHIKSFAPDARVLEATPQEGGRRNSNYRLRLASSREPVLLRLYSSRDELASGACAREAALLQLIDSRVLVPRVLHSEPAADPPWNLMTWIDGTRFDLFLKHNASPSDVEATSRSAGRALAAIHAYEFERPGWFGPDLSLGPPPWPDISWSEMLTGWVADGNCGARLGADLQRRVLTLIRDQASHVQPLLGARRLVHSDFKPWNLLARDGTIAGVIDWEGAYSGNPLVDLGIYLRYSDSMPPEYREGFARGYVEAGGHLPDDWFHLIRLIDLINLAYFLEFTGTDPQIVRDVLPLIETTLADFAP
jgi:aminoglycoside phosphotransferase (APT) family kinase protein